MEGRSKAAEKVSELTDKVQGSQAWSSIFRPGSIFRKGYTDSPRNRSYVIMNSVLYHLHPVKVKRHAVKVSYTLCLGGLSFFLFILLTVTGIFLMFAYRPTDAQAYQDIQALKTQVAFGVLVVMWSWNDFLWPLIVTNTREMRVLPIGIYWLRAEEGNIDWGAIMAGTLFVVLPVVLVFLYAQRYIVDGIAAGAVKG